MTEHMDIGGRSRLVWPCILAASLFFIPIILLFAYPLSFWCSTDNEPVGLANALNMAYRLADLRLYPAEGMTNHPGVQFYFMSWLALAFTGYPVAGAGQEFFQAVIDHADDRLIAFHGRLCSRAGRRCGCLSLCSNCAEIDSDRDNRRRAFDLAGVDPGDSPVLYVTRIRVGCDSRQQPVPNRSGSTCS